MKEFDKNSSPISQIIGVGTRRYKDSSYPTTDFHPWKRKEFLRMFETYPISETYGLSLKSAMELPLDIWQDIVTHMERLGPKKEKDRELEIISLIRDIFLKKSGV